MYDKNQPETIQTMFGSIAHHYDKANAILSLGLHKYWNQCLIKKVSYYPCDTFLDLCAGTGDIGINFLLKKRTIKHAYLLDFCAEMLEVAKIKSKNISIESKMDFLVADAQDIPLDDHSVDCVTTAYGIRNIKNLQKCSSEVLRVLKNGGVWGILELTQPQNLLLRTGHKFYLSAFLPQLGKIVAKNESAYQYLSKSIQEFIVPQKIEKLMLSSGFKKVSSYPLMSGVATIILCQK